MRLHLFIYLILIAQFNANAQKKGYEPGYIVTVEGDTVRGWVQDRDPGVFEELYTKIRFVEEGKKRRKKYSANQIMGYGYGSNTFESVPMKEEMQLLVTGYYLDEDYPYRFLKLIKSNTHLTHYEQEFDDEDSNMIDNYPLFRKRGSFQMVRVTQGILGLKRLRLQEYFSDCNQLVKAIKNKEVNSVNEVYDFYSSKCNSR